MRPILAAVTDILFCVHLASAADTVPDVKTSADLRKLPAIRTDTGYDVRVGMADPGTDAGPYRIIYCLSQPAGPHQGNPPVEDCDLLLGPLGVQLRSPHEAAEKSETLGAILPPGESLFVGHLPVGWIDGQVVRVFDGKKLLLERDLGKAD